MNEPMGPMASVAAGPTAKPGAEVAPEKTPQVTQEVQNSVSENYCDELTLNCHPVKDVDTTFYIPQIPAVSLHSLASTIGGLSDRKRMIRQQVS